MKRWLIPAVALVIALAAAIYYQQRIGGRPAGAAAPEFALADLGGQTRHLSDYRGKVVFLNLWATWCPPCREEMPSMERLHRHFSGRDFVILAVSEDTQSAPVQAFVSEQRLSFPILLDSEGILPGPLGVTGYPETFIIDRNGRIIQHFIGPEEWDSAEAFSFIETLLRATPESAP